jgi:hypothetical protein
MKAVVAVGAAGGVVMALAEPGRGAPIGRLLLCLLIVLLAAPAVTAALARFRAEDAAAFVPHDPAGSPSVVTPDVTELARLIGESRGTVPTALAARLRTVAAGRLLDRHLLHVERADDRAAARNIVGDRLWALLEAGGDGGPEPTLRSMPFVLDDLDEL